MYRVIEMGGVHYGIELKTSGKGYLVEDTPKGPKLVRRKYPPKTN